MPSSRYELRSSASCKNGERQQAIELAAYLKAEADGFRGDPLAYWLQAEQEHKAQENADPKSAWRKLLHRIGVTG